MKKQRFSVGQIAAALKQAELGLPGQQRLGRGSSRRPAGRNNCWRSRAPGRGHPGGDRPWQAHPLDQVNRTRWRAYPDLNKSAVRRGAGHPCRTSRLDKGVR